MTGKPHRALTLGDYIGPKKIIEKSSNITRNEIKTGGFKLGINNYFFALKKTGFLKLMLLLKFWIR